MNKKTTQFTDKINEILSKLPKNLYSDFLKDITEAVDSMTLDDRPIQFLPIYAKIMYLMEILDTLSNQTDALKKLCDFTIYENSDFLKDITEAFDSMTLDDRPIQFLPIYAKIMYLNEILSKLPKNLLRRDWKGEKS